MTLERFLEEAAHLDPRAQPRAQEEAPAELALEEHHVGGRRLEEAVTAAQESGRKYINIASRLLAGADE